MNGLVQSNMLHRVVKLAMDTGEAGSLAEAQKIFAGYRLAIEVGGNIAHSPTLQAALLTSVNAGRRCFLGGVYVSGDLDVPLKIPWRSCRTLAEAVHNLQGKLVHKLPSGAPRILVGDTNPSGRLGEFCIRLTFNGWCGGVIPIHGYDPLAEKVEFSPSGVLAGALGVSEAFQFVRGDTTMAGHREVGLSLWEPDVENHWLQTGPGPEIEYLPSHLWLIGLGHLGQAYLWTLGFLPYHNASDVHLVLQDFDLLEVANDSTSLLTHKTIIGQKKTRMMAHWCGERGFQTSIIERKFAANFSIGDNGNDEPQLALCGVDNALARSALEEVGFKRIIEAGLGKGTQEYLSFQIHTFPASRSAQKAWGTPHRNINPSEALVGLPAYQALAKDGHDACGLTVLAERTVGAPFVGTVAATLVIAEALRQVNGGPSYELIDGDMRSINHRKAFRYESSLPPFNPGFSMWRNF